ncbi:MAG TPA: aminotransferase class I/II-fold pyridoxal phosphate-dependent enzyme [Gemmatimonadales bacterium]|nr:aminotransferase class I/II-fold pyridoxal phosphate-dependent enzyme [Gemmatimonadales bacterium]
MDAPHVSRALVPDPYGSHEPPIYQTSTFTFDSAAQAAALFAGEKPGFVYTRLGNPTVAAWEARLAALEAVHPAPPVPLVPSVPSALAFSSGMGAISATLLALAGQGDHVVATEPLYGGTAELLGDLLPHLGIRVTTVRAGDADGLRRAVSLPRTVALFVETPANPTLDVVDLRLAAALAQEVGARLVVDNTFATPVFQRPLQLGADIVVHSSTKYLGGHGTVIGGAVVTTDTAWLNDRLLTLRKLLGAVPSPFDAWLLYQGSKTLELRVRRASETALRLAQWLAAQPAVSWVRYPGLPDDPGHEVASRQMSGYGAMVAFGIKGGMEAGARFLDALRVAKRAVSLGCTDTLVEHPATMTHAHLPKAEREAAGICDDLIRVSVGLEDLELIQSDFEQALGAARLAAAVDR